MTVEVFNLYFFMMLYVYSYTFMFCLSITLENILLIKKQAEF